MPTVYADAYHVTVPTSLTTTGETTVYTVPTTRVSSFVQQIRAADTGGAARTITVVWRSNGTDYTLCHTQGMNDPEPLDLKFDPLVLAGGDSIKCTASNGSVHVIVNAIEIGAPAT